jgi:hypothetical protein
MFLQHPDALARYAQPLRAVVVLKETVSPTHRAIVVRAVGLARLEGNALLNQVFKSMRRKHL